MNKAINSMLIATMAMIAMLGALCIATPAMAEETVNVYINVDGMTPRNPVIGVGEYVCWWNDQESPRKIFTIQLDGRDPIPQTISYKTGFSHPFRAPGYYEYSVSYTYMDGTTERIRVMFGTVEVTGTKVDIAGCEDLDQVVLVRYDHNEDGEIDFWEINDAMRDYDDYSITQNEYEHIAYAYEHYCLVGSIVSPTPEPTSTPLDLPIEECEDLDQDLLTRYDFDDNGQIDSNEMEAAKIGYDSNYETRDDYEQILYAYEHYCLVGSIVSPTPEPTSTPLDLPIEECEDLDQDLLTRYDFDDNGQIDSNEMEAAKIGYDSNYETRDDYEQILYAYEHRCLVGSAVSPTPTATAQPTPTTVVTPTPTKPKFRVGPTVVLRPVDDVIDKSQNGLVELYMNNPSLNDATLTADVQISVPSGIHISGDGFGYGGAAGVVAGTFTVPPGTVRTININIRGEKTGVFTIHFTGLYWADGDKDAFQQVSLTHRLTVTDPDVIETPVPVPTEANTPSPDTGPINNTESDSIPTTYIVIGMGMLVVLLIIIIAARK